MAGQINISGSTEAVQLHGNDDYTVARDFTFPDESGELLIKDSNDNVEQGIDNINVGSINGGPLAGLRNRFTNGSFDVWQRSLDVTSAGSDYKTADRWYIETNGVNTVSKRIDIDDTTNALKDEAPTTYGMRLHANGAPLEVRQCIELTKTGAAQDFPIGSQWWVTWYSDLRNGSTGNDGTFIDCRVAFMDNSSDAGANTETIGPLTNLGGRRWGFPITIATAPPSTATCLRIDLVTGNVNEFEFTAVQFEPGPVATPFEHRPIALELQLCRRYYMRLTMQVEGPGGLKTDVWHMGMRTTPIPTSLSGGATAYPKSPDYSVMGTSTSTQNGTIEFDAEL